MRIYKDLNLVEQLGSGVPRILETYPKSCFTISDNFLRMSFPKEKNDQVADQVTDQVTDQVEKFKFQIDKKKLGYYREASKGFQKQKDFNRGYKLNPSFKIFIEKELNIKIPLITEGS